MKELKQCKHQKGEQKYLCMAQQCIQGQELMCYKCICQVHQHQECVEHIDDIYDEAKKHQDSIIKYLNEGLQFYENLYDSWNQTIQDIKTKFLSQLDNQDQAFQKELKKLTIILQSQKQKISQIELTTENVGNIVEFRCYNPISYNDQIKAVQSSLTETQSEFQNLFNFYFDRFSSNLSIININDDCLELIPTSYIEESCVKLEKCQETNCRNYKNMFCTHKNCLKRENLNLQCPQCIVKEHCDSNMYVEHAEYFMTADQLFALQKKRKQGIDSFCTQKSREIISEKIKFNKAIHELIKFNERKYYSVQQLMTQQEEQVHKTIQQFKQQYEREGFVIQKELVEDFDFEKQVDIVQLQQNYNRVVSLFNNQCDNQQEITQEEFQEIWDKGLYQVNSDQRDQSDKIINPVAIYIQELHVQQEQLQICYDDSQNDHFIIQEQLKNQIEDLKNQINQKDEELLISFNAFKELFDKEINIVKKNISQSSNYLKDVLETKLLKEQLLPNLEAIKKQLTNEQDSSLLKIQEQFQLIKNQLSGQQDITIKIQEDCLTMKDKLTNQQDQSFLQLEQQLEMIKDQFEEHQNSIQEKLIEMLEIQKTDENYLVTIKDNINSLTKQIEKNQLSKSQGHMFSYPITCSCSRYASEEKIINKMDQVLHIKSDLQQYLQMMNSQYKYLEKQQDKFIENLAIHLDKQFEKFFNVMHSRCAYGEYCDSPALIPQQAQQHFQQPKQQNQIPPPGQRYHSQIQPNQQNFRYG